MPGVPPNSPWNFSQRSLLDKGAWNMLVMAMLKWFLQQRETSTIGEHPHITGHSPQSRVGRAAKDETLKLDTPSPKRGEWLKI